LAEERTLLDRAKWCCAYLSAENSFDNSVKDLAEVFLNGIEGYKDSDEWWLKEELKLMLGLDQNDKKSLEELVRLAEKQMAI
jgi:hypothetical protein